MCVEDRDASEHVVIVIIIVVTQTVITKLLVSG